MELRIRRLGAADEGVLRLLAEEDADFDVPGRGSALHPLAPADARAYLSDPAVLHWVAEADGRIVGQLICHVLGLSSGAGREVLLYDIGIRESARRRGVGEALLEEMRRWMAHEAISEAWVLADNPGAEAFYAAGGFVREEEQPIYMSLTVRTRS